MNEVVTTSGLEPATAPIRTVAALQGRRWTTDELLAWIADGRIHPDLEYELIDGEVVDMPSEGPVHLDLCDEIANFLIKIDLPDIRVAAERQFNLTDATHVKPDLVVRPATIRMSALRGPQALLVVEIADTSLEYDTTTKANIYAAHGVREYWVIDAQSRATHVFRNPTATGYGEHVELPPDARLVPHLAPGLAIRLADLPPAD